ncbi:MAG TPA: ABC transporter permease [Pseudonocardiaceae bacterium]|jgi:peptide/nickel transport system permease protein|nr:ABC transporter permease [Pseudonocardiaceae bacterium]
MSRPSQLRDIWARYRRNKLAMVGLVVVAILVVTAIVGDYLTPYDAFEQNLLNATAPPSAEHWLGTDVLGRDLFSELVYGVRLAMIVAVSTVALSLVLGVSLGALAGYRGRATDTVLMRATDIFLAFPVLVGAIVVVRAAGQGIWPVIVALALFSWPVSARLMRGQVLALREADYVEAARSIGAGSRRIVVRHILPNAIAPVLVYAFTSIGVVVVGLASLSYLGIGVPPNVPEWGRLISQSVPFLRVPGKTHLWLYPAIAICVTTLGFALVADGLRDSLDPKLRGEG